MIYRRTYRIDEWLSWDHEIDEFVNDFTLHFLCSPNILLASRPTFARINMIADPDNIANPDGDRPEPGEYAQIGRFDGDGYQLRFCIHPRMHDQQVALLYDSNPDSKEPLPDEDSEEIFTPEWELGEVSEAVG